MKLLEKTLRTMKEVQEAREATYRLWRININST